MQRVNALAQDLARNRSGILNIVSSPSVGQSFIPQAMAQFRRQFPGCKLTFACHSYEHLGERLFNHQADLGIISLPMTHPNLEVVPLCQNRLVCALPYNHPLAGKAVLSLDDLVDADMIGYGNDTPLGRMIGLYCQREQKELSYVVEVGSPQNAGSLVAMGVGLALVDEFTVRSWAGSHPLWVRPLRDAPVLQANLVHLRYEPLSQLTQSFIAVLREQVRQQGFHAAPVAQPCAEAASH
ncbi:MAG: HTH-type transcriptional activator CmpR [Paracidovorax wautersii]|uniref:HTH-type transcriptional activator CmpR n=1 Tax=Paracidovorax wautersii TaxID=1177982 RepID=A0A7V8JPE1_9BURK|nr:MAG: HTH-type transcriptional activator CmpR [Paracidovorax wautersii]